MRVSEFRDRLTLRDELPGIAEPFVASRCRRRRHASVAGTPVGRVSGPPLGAPAPVFVFGYYRLRSRCRFMAYAAFVIPLCRHATPLLIFASSTMFFTPSYCYFPRYHAFELKTKCKKSALRHATRLRFKRLIRFSRHFYAVVGRLLLKHKYRMKYFLDKACALPYRPCRLWPEAFEPLASMSSSISAGLIDSFISLALRDIYANTLPEVEGDRSAGRRHGRPPLLDAGARRASPRRFIFGHGRRGAAA